MTSSFQFLITLFVTYASFFCYPQKTNYKSIFAKDNLIPWSIVGFDIKERSPEQRLEMLERLGYKQYAYGYRTRHIPTMFAEWKLAKEKGIKIRAVWLYINLKKDKVESVKPESEIVFQNLKKASLKNKNLGRF